jgi:hypothetical protein
MISFYVQLFKFNNQASKSSQISLIMTHISALFCCNFSGPDKMSSKQDAYHTPSAQTFCDLLVRSYGKWQIVL